MDQKEFAAIMGKNSDDLNALTQVFKQWQAAQSVPLKREWIIAQAGASQPIRVPDAKSMYVDNTSNPNFFTITLDGELGQYSIPGYSGAHLPIQGVQTLTFGGIGTAYIRISNIAVPPTSVNANVVVLEGYGATVASRPLATAVPVGYVWESVSTQEFWQSDGTNWVVI